MKSHVDQKKRLPSYIFIYNSKLLLKFLATESVMGHLGIYPEAATGETSKNTFFAEHLWATAFVYPKNKLCFQNIFNPKINDSKTEIK